MLFLKSKLLRKKINNERGSFTLEFLGVIPYFLLFFLILWQTVISGYAVMTAQSAVNEGAKVYAVTESRAEAAQKARAIVGNGSSINVQSFVITGPDGQGGGPDSQGNFEARIRISHGLVFIPERWRDSATISFTHNTSGKVIR